MGFIKRAVKNLQMNHKIKKTGSLIEGKTFDEINKIEKKYDGKLGCDLSKRGYKFGGKQCGIYYYVDPDTGNTLNFKEGAKKSEMYKHIAENRQKFIDGGKMDDTQNTDDSPKNTDNNNVEKFRDINGDEWFNAI